MVYFCVDIRSFNSFFFFPPLMAFIISVLGLSYKRNNMKYIMRLVLPNFTKSIDVFESWHVIRIFNQAFQHIKVYIHTYIHTYIHSDTCIQLSQIWKHKFLYIYYLFQGAWPLPPPFLPQIIHIHNKSKSVLPVYSSVIPNKS